MLRFRPLLLAATVSVTAMLASCSATRNFDFTTTSSRQSAYHASALKPAAAVAEEYKPATPTVEPVAVPSGLTASTAPTMAPAPEPAAARLATPAAPRLSEQLTSARAERTLTRAQERRYERVLSRVSKEEKRREASGQKVEAIELILAIFLPPIGVLVHEKGQLTSRFWISLLLTFLFFIPGMIYSILVVTDTI